MTGPRACWCELVMPYIAVRSSDSWMEPRAKGPRLMPSDSPGLPCPVKKATALVVGTFCGLVGHWFSVSDHLVKGPTVTSDRWLGPVTSKVRRLRPVASCVSSDTSAG